MLELQVFLLYVVTFDPSTDHYSDKNYRDSALNDSIEEDGQISWQLQCTA
jgi:hypothetical protein